MRLLAILVLGLPAAFACKLLGAPPWTVFAGSAIALLPLAGWIGMGTEHAAKAVGPSLGGLLSATFGNAAELIITIFALREGLTDLVKASLTGSIIGNTLLVFGASAVAGGVKHGAQRFDARTAGRHSAMMISRSPRWRCRRCSPRSSRARTCARRSRSGSRSCCC
jgi:Ca2+:H+ antiporter